WRERRVRLTPLPLASPSANASLPSWQEAQAMLAAEESAFSSNKRLPRAALAGVVGLSGGWGTKVGRRNSEMSAMAACGASLPDRSASAVNARKQTIPAIKNAKSGESARPCCCNLAALAQAACNWAWRREVCCDPPRGRGFAGFLQDPAPSSLCALAAGSVHSR